MRNSLTESATEAVREGLAGRRRGFSLFLPFVGPAVVVSVAYMDPGNFATNIQAGARYGYELLWVVLLASAIAMLFQSLSAKLGIITGQNLAELCRTHFPRPVVVLMWTVSEIAAIATDVAELLGGAIGFSLLLHVSVFLGLAVTAAITYALLLLERSGFRPLELAIGALVAVIGLCYVAELVIAPVAWSDVATHLLTPKLRDADALTIAVGIVGATVMPHVLFLHSGFTQNRARPRDERERTKVLRFSNLEVVIALSVAGIINLAMVILAAGAFGATNSVADIQTAYRTLTPLLGSAAAAIFLVSVIASGTSSSVVGTMAGQMIMQGFVGFRIPLWLRRAITMVPSFIVVGAGVDLTKTLIATQVMLSLALPFPMLALVWFTCHKRLMGPHRNRLSIAVLAVTAALMVVLLNVLLIMQTFD